MLGSKCAYAALLLRSYSSWGAKLSGPGEIQGFHDCACRYGDAAIEVRSVPLKLDAPAAGLTLRCHFDNPPLQTHGLARPNRCLKSATKLHADIQALVREEPAQHAN